MNLVEIRKKIASTRNTRKITHALRLVAANKMRRFQRKAEGTRAFAWTLLRGLHQAGAQMEDLAYGARRSSGKTLFVLVTSDMGLCGALNARLIRLLQQSPRWNALPADQRVVLTVGRKAAEAARRNGWTSVGAFEGMKEQMTPLDALAVVDRILSLWNEEGTLAEVVLVSPHYVNAFTAHPTEKNYLPFSEEMVRSHLRWEHPDARDAAPDPVAAAPLFEPSEERVRQALGDQLVQAMFLQAFYELKAAEYSSRMVSMKKATEAADDVVRTLTLAYHKARQSAITQSLAELAAAGAAVA